MEDYRGYADESAPDPDDEFEALLLARSELSHALRDEEDPARRQALLSRLSENRAEILRLQRELGLDSPQSAALRTSRSQVVDPWPAPDTSEQPATGPYDYGTVPVPESPPVGAHRRSPESMFRGSGPAPMGGARGDNMTRSSSGRTLIALALAGVLGVLAAALAFRFLGDGSEPSTSDLASETSETSLSPSQDTIDQIMAVLGGMGLNGIIAEDRDSVIHLIGIVGSEEERATAIGAAQALAGQQVVDGSELIVGAGGAETATEVVEGSREAALQGEIDRVIAATPIIFETGQTDVTELHLRILNNLAMIMAAYPGAGVKVVGFTDDQGSDEANRAVSLARAESVKAYLVSQGLSDEGLIVEARGEDTSSGSTALAGLERRVEFEVVPGSGSVAPNESTFRVAIVAPSARNDLAFTQSMVDAVSVIAAERGNVQVSITDNTFIPEEAAAAIRGYAADGFDLVIAHGSQFGDSLIDIAPEFPDVAFAWGTAADTFGQDNIYAYDAAAEQGGYVMGAMSALISSSGVVGVVGPIEVGDAERYVNGFRAGAEAEKPTNVLVTYIGSFSETTLAADTARAHIEAGADVMTGSAQMVVGAVSVASESNVNWFGTQANQSSLAPTLVVASQVYHWEVILRDIVTDIDTGARSGQAYTADLANGGLIIEYNPGVTLPPEVRQRADQLVAGIVDGSVLVAAG